MQANAKRIPLVEMFGPTIQGEGAVIGQQTYFMRFGLCDYKCRMCDSMNAVDPLQVKANARFLTLQEILDEFLNQCYQPNSTRWVTLSGGNPCIHDLEELVLGLRRAGFSVAVETQGTFTPRWLSICNVVTVSPKGPGMGENTDLAVLDRFIFEHHSYSNIKVVAFDQRDLEFAKMLWERYSKIPNLQFFLSQGNPYPPGYKEERHPSSYADYVMIQIGHYKMLFEEIKTDPILSKFKLLPQFHTWLWGNEKGK